MNRGFFIGNRQRVIDSLGGGLVVIAGYTGMQWQNDEAVPFKQEANFWYLTGIERADWTLIIGGKRGEEWLVMPNVDAVHQAFDGSLSAAEAEVISGVEQIIDAAAGDELLRKLAKEYDVVHTLGEPPHAKYADFTLNPAPKKLRTQLKKLFNEVKDCQNELAKLRAIKQPEEIAAITGAGELTINALETVKAKLSTFTYEYEVEAELTYLFRRHNAKHAFEPIVASGKNACTLHYVSNTDRLQGDQLLLIDVGASHDGYPGDITRTFAVGEPTKRQKAVHKAVRQAEQQIIQLLRPGLAMKEYLESVDAIMQDALISLGLMKNREDMAAYRHYFPHAVSHGLGVDVHDRLGGYAEFQPGMVLTVEPGIYIPEEGIGVRIEDDILITERGYQNLTAKLSTDL